MGYTHKMRCASGNWISFRAGGWWLLAALTALAACRLPDNAEYGRPCEEDRDCTRPYVCVDATCLLPFTLGPADAGDALPDVNGPNPTQPDASVPERDDGGLLDAGTHDASTPPNDAAIPDAATPEDASMGTPPWAGVDAGDSDGGESSDSGLDAGDTEGGTTPDADDGGQQFRDAGQVTGHDAGQDDGVANIDAGYTDGGPSTPHADADAGATDSGAAGDDVDGDGLDGGPVDGGTSPEAGPAHPSGILVGHEIYVSNNRTQRFAIELDALPTDLPNASLLVVAMTYAPIGSPPIEMVLTHDASSALPLLPPGRSYQAFYVAQWANRQKIELECLAPSRFSGLHLVAYLLQDLGLEQIHLHSESMPSMALSLPIEGVRPGDILLGNAMAGSQAFGSLQWVDGGLHPVGAHVVRSGESSALVGERVIEAPLTASPWFVTLRHEDGFLPFIDLVVAHLQPAHP